MKRCTLAFVIFYLEHLSRLKNDDHLRFILLFFLTKLNILIKYQ